MTHWRPFRSPRSFASALSEIEAGSGSRYDPRLSRLFVTLLRRLQRETDDLDRFLAEGAENSPVVQEQRRLAKLLRPSEKLFRGLRLNSVANANESQLISEARAAVLQQTEKTEFDAVHTSARPNFSSRYHLRSSSTIAWN